MDEKAQEPVYSTGVEHHEDPGPYPAYEYFGGIELMADHHVCSSGYEDGERRSRNHGRERRLRRSHWPERAQSMGQRPSQVVLLLPLGVSCLNHDWCTKIEGGL